MDSTPHTTIYPVPGTLGTQPISLPHKIAWLSQENLYECQYCKILYQDEILHDLHMQAHSSNDPFKCICGYDATVSNNIHSFNVHLILGEHPLPPRYTYPGSPWIPLFPPTGSLNTPTISQEIRERWIMCNDPLYECGYCRILYTGDVIHNVHMMTHKGFAFNCVCGFSGGKYQFNAHIYMHGHNLGPPYYFF